MSPSARLALAVALVGGCTPARTTEHRAAPAPHVEAPPPPAAERPGPAAQTASFGAPIDPATPEVELAALARDPAALEGRRVRARGTVHRVCTRAGCWMELADEGVAPIFVPMAGHAFFLPREALGQRAEVEGVVELRTMGPGERAHLEEEGATAASARAQLVASGVRLEGPADRHGS